MPLIGFALSLPSPLTVAGGFSPLDLSPTLWLDASDAPTITESGGAVSQWDDKSGNDSHVTQATSTEQPTTGTRTLNSLNVLDFDGTNDFLRTASSVWSLTTATYFAVVVPDRASGNAMYILDGTPTSARHIVGTTASQYRLFAGTVVDQGTTSTDPQILRAVFNGASSTLHVDGVSTLSGNIGTDTSTAATVGASDAGAAEWDGAIAEIIVVDGTLTASQISDTETYLTNKWIPIPIQLNATAWFDASNSFSITESSGSVSQWDDLSGNGYHLTQGTGSAQPKTGTATLNSLNVIEYDGADTQWLANASMPWNGISLTVFAVYEINASDTEYTLSGGNNTTSYLYLAIDGNTSTSIHGAMSDTSLYLDGVEFTGTTRDDVHTAVGNAPVIVRATGTSTLADPTGLNVGYQNVQYKFGSGSKVAELFVLEDPAPADVATAESYLAEKWGITLQEFSPADLSPTLWLDASDTGTITESGGSVSQWNDKSGNGYNLTQATSSNQPTTGTRTINGLNVLDFDGSADYLNSAASVTELRASRKFTVFAVYVTDAPLQTGGIVSAAQGANAYTSGMDVYRDSTQLRVAVGKGDGAQTSPSNFAERKASTTSTVPMLARVTGSAADALVEIYIDGVDQSPLSTGGSMALADYMSIGSGDHAFYAGARWAGNGPQSYHLGAIAEIIVTDSILTTQQIYDTEQYLADKWGITLS